MTLEEFWLTWLLVFSLGGTGLALYLAVFTRVVERSAVQAHVWHLRQFGIALCYGVILLVATEYLGLMAEAVRRALLR